MGRHQLIFEYSRHSLIPRKKKKVKLFKINKNKQNLNINLNNFLRHSGIIFDNKLFIIGGLTSTL